MTQHPPKLYALEALVEGRLSVEGRRRVDRHLAACDLCRAALTSVREYATLRDAARSAPMPELSWDKLASALDRQPAPTARHAGKLLALALPVLAVAATVLIGWIGITGQRNEALTAARTATKAAPAVLSKAEEAPLTGWVTAGALDGRTPGSSITEGDVLRTRVGEELHVRFSDNTGIVLWPNSELTLARLRPHDVRLSLARGGVSNVVQKLAHDASYAVAAGELSAEVRGTHFFVGKSDDGVHIEVHEGQVAVLQQGKQIDLLQAGQRHLTTSAKADDVPDRSVLGLDTASKSWPSLTLPKLPEGAAWHVGDARLSAPAPFAVRVPVGEASLSLEDTHGKLHPLKVSVPSEGAAVDDATVREALHEEARVGVLEPGQITPVIEAALPSLRRCYEQSLLQRPNLEGEISLAVRVAADGHVARTQLRGGAESPRELSQCIAKQAKGWQFAAPRGGPAAFEIGLNLKSSGAR